MNDRHLVFASPPSAGAAIPNRPGAIWAALLRAQAFRSSVRIERRRPDRYLAGRLDRSASSGSAELQPGARFVAHPWPFGPLERRFLRRQVERGPGRSVLWISDPKSAPVFADLAALGRDRCLLVFDAYDAWDLSPLVRGRRRLAAVAAGYEAAAAHADVVFSNTPFGVDRFKRWGGRNVVLLPNAAPSGGEAGRATPGRATPGRATPASPFLLYVGRVHERVDTTLLAAIATAFPRVELRIAGPVEREPAGWDELTRLPNVRLLGAVPGEAARSLMAAAAACLIPHIVDDYSRSQDTMKAWDAISVGAPVISTAVPPANAWGSDLALIAADPAGFVAAVGRVLGGRIPGSRERRMEYAAANTWDTRAGQALSVLERALRE